MNYTVSRARLATAAAAVTALAYLLPACGGGTVTFGGDDDDNKNAKVTFKGNLDAISPVTTRDIVVFVYSIDNDDSSERCPCPPDPSDSLVGKAVVLASGDTEFTISGLDPGPFGVVFLLDEPGDSADGEIDPGDPIAILDDVDCELDDVSASLTVTLIDVDLNLDSVPAQCNDGAGDPPFAGRARADRITFQKTATD